MPPSRYGQDNDFNRRMLFVIGGGGVLWTVLLARLIQLQGLDQEKLQKLAIENQYNFEPAIASRGIVYDRFGAPLAVDKNDFKILITPDKAYRAEQFADIERKEDRLAAALDALGEAVWLPERARAKVLREARRGSAYNPIQVLSGVSWEDIARVNVLKPELPGVEGQLGRVLAYPHGPVFAHIIGYVARPNEQEIESIETRYALNAGAARGKPAAPGDAPATSTPRVFCPSVDPENLDERQTILRTARSPDYRLGKSGIEACAQGWLEGAHGLRAVLVTARGRRLEEDEAKSRAALPGEDLVLTIDADLQEFAYRAVGDNSAAVVVMDCVTGDLYCLLSAPAYDPNNFVNGVSNAEYRALLQNDHKPLYAKATKGIYPPGSTFKMATALAALKIGINPKERVNCTGRLFVGNHPFHCWRREGHGPMDLHNGIKHSCDVYFWEMARRAGADAIAEAAAALGLGEIYDIGLPDMSRGIRPDPAWKKTRYNQPWTTGDTVNYGIGQGYIITSPLQLAVMTARLGNGKFKVQPRLIRRGPPELMPPEIAAEPLPFDPAHLALVLDGMNGVSNEPGGTALVGSQMNLPSGEKLAGKTGSAQVRRITLAERARGVLRNDQLPWELRDHALFVCVAPVGNPRYACAVVVEHGSSGAKTAAPLARDIMRETLLRDPARKPVFGPNPRGGNLAASAPGSVASGG